MQEYNLCSRWNCQTCAREKWLWLKHPKALLFGSRIGEGIFCRSNKELGRRIKAAK